MYQEQPGEQKNNMNINQNVQEPKRFRRYLSNQDIKDMVLIYVKYGAILLVAVLVMIVLFFGGIFLPIIMILWFVSLIGIIITAVVVSIKCKAEIFKKYDPSKNYTSIFVKILVASFFIQLIATVIFMALGIPEIPYLVIIISNLIFLKPIYDFDKQSKYIFMVVAYIVIVVVFSVLQSILVTLIATIFISQDILFLLQNNLSWALRAGKFTVDILLLLIISLILDFVVNITESIVLIEVALQIRWEGKERVIKETSEEKYANANEKIRSKMLADIKNNSSTGIAQQSTSFNGNSVNQNSNINNPKYMPGYISGLNDNVLPDQNIPNMQNANQGMNPNMQNTNQRMNPNMQNANQGMNPNMQNTNQRMNPNMQNPNQRMNPNMQNANQRMNPNMQNPNQRMNPNMQNPNQRMNPNMQNPNQRMNPNMQNANQRMNPNMQNANQGMNPNMQNANQGMNPNMQNANQGMNPNMQNANQGMNPNMQNANQGMNPNMQNANQGMNPNIQNANQGMNPNMQNANQGMNPNIQNANQGMKPNK